MAETWENLTQGTSPALGRSVIRVGVCHFAGTLRFHIRRFYYALENNQLELKPTTNGITFNSKQLEVFYANIGKLSRCVKEVEMDSTRKYNFHIDVKKRILLKQHHGWVVLTFQGEGPDRILQDVDITKEIHLRKRDWMVLLQKMDDIYALFKHREARMSQNDGDANRNLAPIDIQLVLPAQMGQDSETQAMEVDLTDQASTASDLMEVEESEVIAVLPAVDPVLPPAVPGLSETVSKVGPGFKGKLKSTKRKAEDTKNPKGTPKRLRSVRTVTELDVADI